MSTRFSNVGLQVVTGVSTGISAFKETAKRNLAVLMERDRGVIGKVYDISSLDEDVKAFGNPNPNHFGGWFMKSIFQNAGDAPVKIKGVRIAGACAAATGTDVKQSITLTVTAAQKGEDDPGTWGNGLVAKLYAYDSRLRGLFVLELYLNGALVETWSSATTADLQLSVNSLSRYAKINFSGTVNTLYTVAKTGTATVTGGATNFVGVGTAFTTELVVGDSLYTGAGVYIGKVASITSNTVLTLAAPAAAALAGAAFKIRDNFIFTVNLAGGTYTAAIESDFYPKENSGDADKGLSFIDAEDVQLVVCTEFNTLTMAVAGKNYCAVRQNCLFIATTPLNAGETTVEAFANALQVTSGRSWIAVYTDWANVYTTSGDLITIPAFGVWYGAAYLRNTYAQGDFIHVPPGGIGGAAQFVESFVSPKLSQAMINKFVREFTVNVSVASELYGRYLVSSRTMSLDELWQSIHHELQAIYYSKMLDNNMVYITQKANTPELKKDGLSKLRTFFQKEYEVGALERAITFEEAYIAVSDTTNNPLSQSRKQLNIDIEYIPTDCTESVKISLNRNDSYLTVKVK